MKISIELTIQWQTGHGHEACVWWAKPQSPVKWDVTIFVRVGLYCMIREQHSLTIMHILKAVRALDPNNFSSCKVVCVRRMLFVCHCVRRTTPVPLHLWVGEPIWMHPPVFVTCQNKVHSFLFPCSPQGTQILKEQTIHHAIHNARDFLQ